MIFCERAKRREKADIDRSKQFMKTHIVHQTNYQLRQDINGQIVLELQGMEPLNDENKVQVDERNKN